MPDYWTIYILLVATCFGGIVGYIISTNLGRKTALQKTWNNNYKVVTEIQSIEDKLAIECDKDKSGNAYNPPPKITLDTINKQILNNYDRLKVISQKIKVDKSTEKNVETPTIIHYSVLTEKENVHIEDNKDEIPIEPQSSQSEIYLDNHQDIPENFDIEPENLTSQIVNLYNRGINDRTARNEFWGKIFDYPNR